MRTLLLATLLLAGCQAFGARMSDGDGTVTVEEGATARLDALGATLRFDEKLRESRCPARAQCVWAGEAAIRITFRPDDGPAFPVTLSIGGSDTRVPKDTLGYTFTLHRLLPYPDADAPQPDADAVATIAVERAE